jgi:hypothetical protein
MAEIVVGVRELKARISKYLQQVKAAWPIFRWINGQSSCRHRDDSFTLAAVSLPRCLQYDLGSSPETQTDGERLR